MPKNKKQYDERPSWDEYFLNIMNAISERATCDRGKSAAVIVKDKRILVTGYAGSPEGLSHCDEVGHEFHEVIDADGNRSKHCIRTTHAEQNAIAQAARMGIPIEGSTVYANMEPCYTCAKILINAGIQKYICLKRYHGAQRSREIFQEAGVELTVLEDEMETYPDMK